MIRSEVPVIDWPDETLLARWWVDGMPWVCQRAQQELRRELTDLARQLRETKQLEVAFALPVCLGKLKVGTKVGLQVMHADDGFKPLWAQEAEVLHKTLTNRWPVRQPMLSNRLTFALTQKLLAARP